MKVTLVNGSPRNGNTNRILSEFQELLNESSIGTELISLSDYSILPCRGCYACFLRGEQFCPLDDDVREIWQKVVESDGIAIGSPVYSLGVSGILKNFMDRIAHKAHRPEMYLKPLALFSTTAGMGTKNVFDQLNWFKLLGMEVSSKTGIMVYPQKDGAPKEKIQQRRKLIKAREKLLRSLSREKKKLPSLIQVIQFNALKANCSFDPDIYQADYAFFHDKQFFFETQVGPFKRAIGNVFFKISSRVLRSKFGLPEMKDSQ